MLTCNKFIGCNKNLVGILLFDDKYQLTSRDPNIKSLHIEGYEEFMETGILEHIKIKIIYPKSKSSLITVEYITEDKGIRHFFMKPKYKWVCTIKDTSENILIDKMDLNVVYLSGNEDNREKIKELLKCIGIQNVYLSSDFKIHTDLKNAKQQTLEVTM